MGRGAPISGTDCRRSPLTCKGGRDIELAKVVAWPNEVRGRSGGRGGVTVCKGGN